MTARHGASYSTPARCPADLPTAITTGSQTSSSPPSTWPSPDEASSSSHSSSRRSSSDIDSSSNIARIANDLAAAEFAIVFTGAGISTESGLPDYRGENGLWKNKRFEQLANIDTFRREPEEFWQFYAERLGSLHSAEPNAAHFALEKLYQDGRIKGVITQNVDGLHRRAVFGDGLAEIHGTLSVGVCLECDASYHVSEVEAKLAVDGLPRCDRCHAVIKPGVVLFGETLPQAEMARARDWALQADYLLVLGSSCEVYPAAGLPEVVLDNEHSFGVGIINLGPTAYDDDRRVTKAELALGNAMSDVTSNLNGRPWA